MKTINRRQFLDQSVRGAAISMSLAAIGSTSGRVLGANDKVILGAIGVGGRGHSTIQNIVKVNENVEVKYVCDVNATRGARTIEALNKLQGYAPKRIIEMREIFDDKDVHAVQVSTPEHWHALATVWACQAGKDVYVEKCPTLTIWEGRKMIEAAEKYNRIVQVGTQNRSADYGFSAQEYIKNGRLGRVVLVKSYNMLNSGPWSPQPDTDVPEGLDWDRWLGPARWVPYNPGRHSMGSGRGWQSHWDYCGGQLADDGSHVMDLARMAMGDPGHPKSVYCLGGRMAYDDAREVPDLQEITYDFGDFVYVVTCSEFTPYMKKTSGEIRMGNSFPYWPQNSTRTEIYGTKGMMYLGRHGGGWQVFEGNQKVTDFQYGYFPDDVHHKNFIECVRSRKQANGNPVQGHLSATLVHLGNISLRVGNKHLVFDAETETFPNNPEANKFLKPEYRKNYRIPDKV